MRTRFLRTIAVIATASAVTLLAAACGGQQHHPADTAAAPARAKPGSPGGSGAVAKTAVPAAALRFTAKTLDGQRFDGASLAGKDAVLWFWAPWCMVCRAEAPQIAQAAAKWGKKVTFVGIPGRASTADMKQFVAGTGLDGMPQAVDTDGSLWSRFGVVAQPAAAFVNDNGAVEVVPGGMSAEALGEKAERLTLQ